MNKMMILGSFIVSILLINSGFVCRSQAESLDKQKDQLDRVVNVMRQELRAKRQCVPTVPVNIGESFNSFVNFMRMLKSYDGIDMMLEFAVKNGKNSLEEHLIDSGFRNVKALPVILRINKSSFPADPAFFLNDIYFLENQTDFKVDAIIAEDGSWMIKGEIYGI
ncbi:MAG: hypothetical protein KGK03_05025 [Candidatus Omnitrophica bacterium]|nr:hypothetical protein [Candidatus Omnitrophota bacterium]MDE2222417.1 hypothetical protein [Candidatus Omnitrophota bacterium]